MRHSKNNGRALGLALAACLGASLSIPALAQGWNRALDVADTLLKKDKSKADLVKLVFPPEEKPAPAIPGNAGNAGNQANSARTATAANAAGGTSSAQPATSGATVLFSKSPIDPAKPEGTTSTFKAGDSIYSLIRIAKTWRDLLGDGDENTTEVQVPIDMIVDGQNVDFQYVTIKNQKAIDSNVLVLDIAPDPATMTAYKNDGFAYGEGKGRRKIGPDQYTYNLGKLSAGRHTVKFQVRSFGNIFAAGELTLVGADYKPYADLREKILREMLNVGGMPKAQKTDAQLEAQMMKLLLNGGWKGVRRLVIVDKDWWNDLLEGGDSAVIGRHIAAAVAAKADDGTYFWANVTFQQHKLIDGSFGPLEISHTGVKRPIKEENIDK